MSNSIYPGGPVPRNSDRAETALTKLLEIFLNAIDSSGALKVSGGSLLFKDLADTPNSYGGQAGKAVSVRLDELGLEFTSLASAWGSITGNITDQTDLVAKFANYVLTTRLGAANGVATLGSDSKLTGSQIPTALLGDMKFMGFWDASTNTTDPDLGSLSSGSPAGAGSYWVVSTAGGTGLSGISSWNLGDWVVSLGATWGKIDNTDAVISVAGKIGNVYLVKGDVGLGYADNTADVDKPVSTAQAIAIGLKQDALPAGSALQVLRKNAANTALEFATVSGGGADVQDIWMYSGL